MGCKAKGGEMKQTFSRSMFATQEDLDKAKAAYIMPFCEWKAEQLKKDEPVKREREWYYTEYGRYCANKRRANETINQ